MHTALQANKTVITSDPMATPSRLTFTIGGSTPGMEAEESSLAGHTQLHPVHMDQAKGKKDRLGPPKTQPTVHGP